MSDYLNTPVTEESVLALRKAWTDALRSGNYQQGRKYLHNRAANTFCCLGVLCEVLRLPRTDPPSHTSPGANYLMPEGHTLSGALSPSVQRLVGITVNFEGKLMQANDTYGKTFTAIAGMIDAEPIVLHQE